MNKEIKTNTKRKQKINTYEYMMKAFVQLRCLNKLILLTSEYVDEIGSQLWPWKKSNQSGLRNSYK